MAGTDSAPARAQSQDTAYWYVPLVRAVPAAALACVVTFAGGGYTPEFGLLVFGGFALVAGILSGVLNFRALRGTERGLFLVQAVVSVLVGIGALVGWHTGLPLFLVLVSIWAVISGVVELFLGIRARGRRAAARDWIFVGGVTVLLAVFALVIPPGYVQHYTDPTGPRVLNTSVMVVGALAVYGAVVAVYLAIAAFSLKWGGAAAAQKEVTQ